MSELVTIQNIVKDVIPVLESSRAKRVSEIRFRRGNAYSEDALRQAYQTATRGTLLEGATVLFDTANRHFLCSCGHRQVITPQDPTGALLVCPKCGTIGEVSETCDLELVEFITETD